MSPLQVAAAQQQASVGTSAILEASALREEVRRERTRAQVAMQQAEEAMRAHSSSTHHDGATSSDSKLLEVMARLAQREKDVDMLQATVRVHPAQPTVLAVGDDTHLPPPSPSPTCPSCLAIFSLRTASSHCPLPSLHHC